MLPAFVIYVVYYSLLLNSAAHIILYSTQPGKLPKPGMCEAIVPSLQTRLRQGWRTNKCHHSLWTLIVDNQRRPQYEDCGCTACARYSHLLRGWLLPVLLHCNQVKYAAACGLIYVLGCLQVVCMDLDVVFAGRLQGTFTSADANSTGCKMW